MWKINSLNVTSMTNESGQQHEVSRRPEEKQSFDERSEVRITSGVGAGHLCDREGGQGGREDREGGTLMLGERREQRGQRRKERRCQEMGKMETKLIPKVNVLVVSSRAQSTGMARNGGGEKLYFL